MSEPISGPQWALLPPELLEKIFSFIPHLRLADIGLVCCSWRGALHRLAVKHLTHCCSNQLVDKDQLRLKRWSPAAANFHDIQRCACTRLAFGFLTSEGNTPRAREIEMRYSYNSDFCMAMMGEKIFVAYLNSNDDYFSLRVINRLEPNSQPRYLIGSEEDEVGYFRLDDDILRVEILACEDLLVVMEEGRSRVQISLWNGRSETWLTDLDISVTGLTRLGPQRADLESIHLSKNLLAVCIHYPEFRTFFWQLKTSQPEATSPQFLGSVKLREIELNDDEYFYSIETQILMNEKNFAVYFKDKVVNKLNNTFIEAERMLVIAKTELFTADGTLVADKAQFSDPDQVGIPWRRMKDIDLVSGESIGNRDFYLEPGNSCRMAVFSKRSSVFKIVNLATGEDICQICLRGSGLIPASWWGGSFLFAKDLQRPDIREDEAKIQVVVFDPRPSTQIRSIKKLEEEGLLLPGLGVSCSGVVVQPGPTTVKFDYCGIVCQSSLSMFIASIVGDAWI